MDIGSYNVSIKHKIQRIKNTLSIINVSKSIQKIKTDTPLPIVLDYSYYFLFEYNITHIRCNII